VERRGRSPAAAPMARGGGLREMATGARTRGVGPTFYRRHSPRREATRGEGLGLCRHAEWRPAADAAGPGAVSAELNTPRARARRRLGLGAASAQGLGKVRGRPREGARGGAGRRV
jgi:hypothetical protein